MSLLLFSIALSFFFLVLAEASKILVVSCCSPLFFTFLPSPTFGNEVEPFSGHLLPYSFFFYFFPFFFFLSSGPIPTTECFVSNEWKVKKVRNYTPPFLSPPIAALDFLSFFFFSPKRPNSRKGAIQRSG